MAELTKENIAFIDRYLENSNVVYADIRMEMVDHVASEIEAKMDQGDMRPFHDVFKEYMGVNKLRLLDNQNRTISRLTKQLAKKVLKKAFEIQSIFVGVLLMIVYSISIAIYGIEISVWIHLILNLSLIMVSAIVYEFQRKKKKMLRFSGVERLGLIISILVQVVFFTFNIRGLYTESFHWIYSAIFSVQLVITIALIQLGVEQYRIYKANFHFN